MKQSESIIKLSEALCKAQKRIKTAIKNCENPYFHSKYADYGEILNCVKPALNDEGISILQPIDNDVVETVLLHESGEFISSTTRIYNVSNKPQDYGSAITYARRYALSAILSVDSDEDDDGNRANGNGNNNKIDCVLDSEEKLVRSKYTNEERLICLRRVINEIYRLNKYTPKQIEEKLGFPIALIPKYLLEAETKIHQMLTGTKSDESNILTRWHVYLGCTAYDRIVKGVK